MLCLSDGTVGGYSRTALCNPTGQICPGRVKVLSLSSPVLMMAPPPPGASERPSSREVGLKPFCKPTWPRSLAIRVSMKETLSGSRLTFSASTSGILQDEGRTTHCYFSHLHYRVRLIIRLLNHLITLVRLCAGCFIRRVPSN